MNNVKKIFIFMAGVAVGSSVTWKLLKDRYSQLAQEEIDSVKLAFSKKGDKVSTESDEEPIVAAGSDMVEKPSIIEYAAKLQESGYVSYSDNIGDTRKTNY